METSYLPWWDLAIYAVNSQLFALVGPRGGAVKHQLFAVVGPRTCAVACQLFAMVEPRMCAVMGPCGTSPEAVKSNQLFAMVEPRTPCGVDR